MKEALALLRKDATAGVAGVRKTLQCFDAVDYNTSSTELRCGLARAKPPPKTPPSLGAACALCPTPPAATL